MANTPANENARYFRASLFLAVRERGPGRRGNQGRGGCATRRGVTSGDAAPTGYPPPLRETFTAQSVQRLATTLGKARPPTATHVTGTRCTGLWAGMIVLQWSQHMAK